jgi:hypothetical protein
MKILAQRKDPGGDLVPVVVTLTVAVLGAVGILLTSLGPGSDALSSDARKITGAAVSRAGAIEIPSGPTVGRS